MTESLRLDATTLRACAAIARTSADNMPGDRSHHAIASGALTAFAETLDMMAGITPCELLIEVR
jgi:hypothetical protein